MFRSNDADLGAAGPNAKARLVASAFEIAYDYGVDCAIERFDPSDGRGKFK